MEINELLDIIKDAAFQVRLALAPGYLESVYKNALIHELSLRYIKAIAEYPINVNYKGCRVGEFRTDIFVDGRVLIELKACRELTSVHESQLVNYLTATGIDYGFLINYGGERFRIIRKTREYKPGN